jgi:hypothetical protein
MVTSDPKPPKRIRDRDALLRKLASSPLCRNGCGDRATDPHHILLRSQGGDDVEDNILPLCRLCHRMYHDGNITLRINLDERLYVLTKLGQNPGTVYLEKRRYG